MPKMFNFFSPLLFLSFFAFSQSVNLDSLVLSANSMQDDSNKVNALNEISWLSDKAFKYEEALNFASESHKLSETIKFRKGEGKAYSRMGNALYSMGRFDESIENHLKALKIQEEVNDLKGQSATYQNLGNVTQAKGGSPQAMEYYLNSLKIKEKMNDKNGMSNSLNSIGNIFKTQGNFEKAVEFYQKSGQLKKEIGDKMGYAQALFGISTVLGMQGNYEKTLVYTDTCLQTFKKINFIPGIAATLTNMALCYQHLGKFKESMQFHKEALSYNQLIKDKNSIAMSLINIGNLHSFMKNYSESVKYMQDGLTLLKEIGAKDYLKDTYKNLAKVYEQMNKPEKALEYYKFYSDLKDTLNSENKNKLIVELNTKYETEKKELEIALLKTEKEAEKTALTAKNKRQQYISISIAILFLVSSVFGFFMYKNFQQKKKANEKLVIQQKLIEDKNQENELLLTEIHHRVKNNLQVISSLLSLQERNIENSNVKAAIQEGKERVKSMELVHKLLYQGNGFRTIEMKNYCNELTSGLKNSFGISDNNVELTLDFNPIHLDIDTSIPLGLILNELIINSFKHGVKAANLLKIKLTIESDNNSLKVFYSDNGNGKVENLENSVSFGMKIIKALVKQLQGELKIGNDENGLLFSIFIEKFKNS
jgi:two-component system, sensor histidine kinase PdtaS